MGAKPKRVFSISEKPSDEFTVAKLGSRPETHYRLQFRKQETLDLIVNLHPVHLLSSVIQVIFLVLDAETIFENTCRRSGDIETLKWQPDLH